jgi:hypothetical protein
MPIGVCVDGRSELPDGQFALLEAGDPSACSFTVGVVELDPEETPVMHERGYRA